jgi:hypothetical protein
LSYLAGVRLLSFSLLVASFLGCGGGVRLVSDDPRYAGNPLNESAPTPREGNVEAAPDEKIVEPEHPLVDTKPARATVHVHTPRAVCSGVVLGPRLVATARHCLARDLKGVQPIATDKEEYKIEIASSNLTWTSRRVSQTVTAACDRHGLDVAVLVLSEAAAWTEPLRVTSAPGPGAKVEALGFGRCKASESGSRQRVVISRESDEFVLDTPFCRGDMGGPVVDGREGDLVGIVSHNDDPPGSPRKTTSIARLDTTPARALVAQAGRVADGKAAKDETPIACE